MRMFLNYTMGMTAPELCVLLSCGKGQPGVYFYHPEQLLATALEPQQVPWPVEFVLRLHPKHVFASQKLPAMSELGRSIQQWEHKMRWRLFHSQQGLGQNHQSTRGWQKLRDRFATPLCPHRFCDQWEWFFHELKQGVFQQAFVMRNAAKLSDRRPSNFNRVARWGLQMLRSGPIGAVRTDKDGGYALVWKHALTQAILASLTLPHYEERFVHDQTFNDIASEYCGLAKYIGEQTDDDELVNSLLSSLKRGCKNFVTKVLTTVKTHKAEGEQSMRIVHAAPRHFAKPAMRWVAMLIQKHLEQYNHILKDTDHLLRLLREVQVPEDSWLLRFDIKEFYMSGTQQATSDAASTAFPSQFRDSATLMVDHILKSQIVTDGFSDKYFRVNIGSGMGLTCSGELSDGAFCNLAEKDFATNPEIQARYGILFYARFKDDGIIIATCNRQDLIDFTAKFKQKSAPFQLKFEVHRETAKSWPAIEKRVITALNQDLPLCDC